MLSKLFSKKQKTESLQEKLAGDYRMVPEEDMRRYEFQEKLFQTIVSVEADAHNGEDPMAIAVRVMNACCDFYDADWCGILIADLQTQAFIRDENGMFQVPESDELKMKIPTILIPKCPDDGSDVTMNLRADDSFVEDEGWHRASAAYANFLRRHENLHVLYLELGVGANTPVIIKYPFWQMTLANEKAVYACINYGEAFCPGEIADRSICMDGDIGDVLMKMQ